MIYKYIKDNTVVEKAGNDTFVITQYNMTQTALYNQKLSSFNIISATCYPHIMFNQIGRAHV